MQVTCTAHLQLAYSPYVCLATSPRRISNSTGWVRRRLQQRQVPGHGATYASISHAFLSDAGEIAAADAATLVPSSKTENQPKFRYIVLQSTALSLILTMMSLLPVGTFDATLERMRITGYKKNM
jgi:hypothetical protein